MRDFLRKDGEQKETVELDALVKEAAKLIDADARDKGVAIRLNLAQELPRVTVNRVHIEQVLLNLICNGIEAMDASGAAVRKVTMRTRRLIENQLQVSVQDAGTSLNAKVYSRAFEPFYTTKLNGIGIGLAISRSIIGAHAVRLWGEPGIEGGETFYFTLPLTKNETY